jgi:hypothetical protein
MTATALNSGDFERHALSAARRLDHRLLREATNS